MARRFLLALTVVFATSLLTPHEVCRATVAGAALSSRLTDQEFWKIATDASEPNGYFRSDNLTSNELWFQHVIPDLVRRTRPGGVYLGVGPEQNYTYIAAVRPAIAIIFDIPGDRAEFVSLLFSKPRPKGLGASSTAIDLFTAFAASPASNALYERN